MTEQEKQLLLKDLCERLPYGVKIELMPYTKSKCVSLDIHILNDFFVGDVEYKPYLRPMSSMTEEEKREYFDITQVSNHCAAIDWLNAHHFDYRGLIEKGLAIEAPEGMYKI